MKRCEIEKDKWRVCLDANCYALQRARVVKGRLKWDPRGYFPSLANCFQDYCRRSAHESDKDFIPAYRDAVENLRRASDQLAQDLGLDADALVGLQWKM